MITNAVIIIIILFLPNSYLDMGFWKICNYNDHNLYVERKKESKYVVRTIVMKEIGKKYSDSYCNVLSIIYIVNVA